MPDSVFVDTGYLVAILNRRDALHDQARKLAEKWQQGGHALLTTDGVLLELVNFFSKSPLRSAAIRAIRSLRTGPGWTVESLTPTLFSRGETRFAAHPDKTWSLTDCISMEVMLDHGLRDAATPDHHFEQAGFRALLQV